MDDAGHSGHAGPMDFLLAVAGGDRQADAHEPSAGPTPDTAPPFHPHWSVSRDPAGFPPMPPEGLAPSLPDGVVGCLQREGPPPMERGTPPGTTQEDTQPGAGGRPRGSSSSSAQVMFWAGILQAQMCVLDLEEELEKTEGFREELRRCLSSSAKAPDSPRDPSPGAQPPLNIMEDSEEDASETEEGRGGCGEESEGLYPEWGEEEESLFFDNPIFLESPDSDVGVSEELLFWGPAEGEVDPGPAVKEEETPQGCPRMGSPGLLQGEPMAWHLETEQRRADTDAEPDSESPPPLPVPTYKSHFHSWPQEEPRFPATIPAPAAEVVEVRGGRGLAQLGGRRRGERRHLPALGPTLPATQGWPCSDSFSLGEATVGLLQGPAPYIPTPSVSLEPNCPWDTPDPVTPETSSSTPVPTPEESASLQVQGFSSPFYDGRPEPPSLSSPEEADAGPDSPLGTEVGRSWTSRSAPGEKPLSLACPWSEPPAAQGHGSSSRHHPTPPLQADPEPEPEEPRPTGGAEKTADKVANGVAPDPQAARCLAARLYHLDGFQKSDVAAYLRKNNDFSRAVAEEYLSFFQFGGQSLDRAIRHFLQAFVLTGETQERERILCHFSERYHRCNPKAFSSADSVHTLTCALMLLNTDLHGQNIGKSMSCQEFITNLDGMRDGGNFPKEQLKTLYMSIRNEKLEWAMDEEPALPEKARPPPTFGRKASNPFLQLPHDLTAPTYKQGLLARKIHADADGKKTPWGKRGWKMFHTLLRGMVLYFLKGEETCPENWNPVGPFTEEAVGVHHALAAPADHYTKRPHVFQLRTADWRLYLFQASTAKEMHSWIARINLAAATYSSPPFPAAVGSQRKFIRPILPTGPAQSSLEEQHRCHESCLDAASDDLLDLQRTLPERRGRGRDLEEFRLRKEFLEHEKTRYEIYVQLLVTRLRDGPDTNLELWEARLEEEAQTAQNPEPSLKKSHSSPSLHQDEAPTTVKVKRNISERRTYRKIIPKRNRQQE
uniref:PH and SEC7 domain-containing protein 4 n=1 Tax=Ornithorhynchus anatinus TaxID=9258 RepID=A0A6I8P8V0_ORNAN